MSSVERTVAEHYGSDELLRRIDEAFRASGLDPEKLTPDDLAPIEHMHTGGLEATRRAISDLRVRSGDIVLDIGCGIGGTARELARGYDAFCAGIDLVPEFVQTATELSRRVGLQDKTRFLCASALNLPMQDAMFDGVSIMHLGMNIEDKARMLSEAFRVLKHGKRLVICEIMLGPVAEPLIYPVPWAASAETSYLVEPETYRALAAEAGFAPVSETDFYTETLGQSFPQRMGGTPSLLGSHLMMGVAWAQMISNHNENLRSGRVVAVQMAFDKLEASHAGRFGAE